MSALRALAIAPPAGLAARVMLKQSFAPRRWVPRLAVAATVLMAIAATSVTYLWNRPLSLEAEVLAHIHAEPEALAAPGPVDADKLAAVLRALGAQLDSAPGDDAMDGGGTSPGMGEVDRVGSERSRPRRELAVEVRYAGICDIRRRPGAHLVLAGERGPVTVLLMPDERVSQRAPLRTGDLEGVVLPVDGGSMAIVGSRGEPLNALAVEMLHPTRQNAWIAISLDQGRYRQVRRMCEAVGHPVLRLLRVALGPIHLGSLPRGAWRPLTPAELQSLRSVALGAMRPGAGSH